MKKPTNYFSKIFLFITIICFITDSSIKAQGQIFCGTGGGGSNAIGALSFSGAGNGNLSNTGGPYFLKVYPHVIRRSDGSGGQTSDAIEAAFQRLADDFNPHNIFFVRDCETINVIVSDDDYYDFSIYCDLWGNPDYQYDDGISIFFGSDEITNNAGGIAMDIPSKMFWIGGTWPIGQGAPWNAIVSPVLSHEMGHCLGLYHTHHGTITEVGSDCDGTVTELEQCCELVNGSNSNNCGDYVVDTPADPRGYYQQFTSDPPCIGGLVWHSFGSETECTSIDDATNERLDANQDVYSPAIDNTMSYNQSLLCLTGFTPGQGERMRQMISFSPVLQACLVEPEFYSHTINTTTTWTTSNTPNNGDLLIEDELIIESGATLTIDNNVTVRFGEEGRIVIKPNGNLFLEGTLTGKGCGITWRGIEVWGNSNESQYSVGGTRAQGRFVGRSGSVVENAETAVRLYGPSYTNHAGGQISCNGTSFRNNTVAVEFAPYENFWPYSWPSGWEGQPRSYFGYFTSCNFENNNDYPHALGFNSFLHLTGVNGVRVSGSHFTNTQSIADCSSVADYGYGIFATDAGFRVQARCTSSTYPCSNYVHSTFNGLGYGIHTSTAVNNRPYTIRQTDFSNCYFGIKSNAVSNGTLLFNDFYLGNVPDACLNSGEQLGVFFETGISGFTMQENDFIGEGGNVSTTVGSLCKNMGQFNNVIRRNYYSNLNYANVAEGENATGAFSDNDRGLHYLCNQNSSVNQADFAVVDGPSVDRIRTGQGLEVPIIGGGFDFNAAGNRFSYGSGFDINNEGEGIDYYYNPSAPSQTPLSNTGDIILFEAPNSTCPEDYCEPPCKTHTEIALEKEKYYEDRTKEQTAKTEKEAAEAAGDAELAEQKSKEADYYRQKMDKEAFMVVLHLMHDTLMFHPDTLTVWLENLDVFGTDMIWAMSQQVEGNTAVAQQLMQRATQRPDLSAQQKKDLQDAEVLLRVLNRKSPYDLGKEDLRTLEGLSKRDLSLTAQLARNILTLHGQEFAPQYRLPGARERSENLIISGQKVANRELTVYPNPNSGSFSLDWQPSNKEMQIGTLTITDLSGKVIVVQTVTAFTQNRIELRGQAQGVYFYQLQHEGDKPLIGKFILQ